MVTNITQGENVLNEYEYDAWGEVVHSAEKVENRFKFNGQQLDPITGQYYLRARFYNPVIARFTQEDTYRGDGLNLYAYCRNNPVYYVDPTGHESQPKVEPYPNSQTFEEMWLQNKAEEYVFQKSQGNPINYGDSSVKPLKDNTAQNQPDRPSATELNNSLQEWVRMQKALAPSNSKTTHFNTATVVYDVKTGEYYYGMNKGVKLSGDNMNPQLETLLPTKSLNNYPLGNCAEVDGVNQALNNSTNLDDLLLYTMSTTTDKNGIPIGRFGEAKPACDNCNFTFKGNVREIISG